MCLKNPIQLPTLDPSLNLKAPTPSFSGDVNLCCKLVLFDYAVPPFASGEILAPIFAPLKTARDLAQTFLDGLQFDCPRDP